MEWQLKYFKLMTELSIKVGSSMKQHTNHTDQLKTGPIPLKHIGDSYNPYLQRQHCRCAIPVLYFCSFPQKQRIGTWRELEHRTPFRSEASVVQEDVVL